MSYAETIAKQFEGDPIGLLLYINRDIYELSHDKKANEYDNYRKIIRTWVDNWAKDSS